MNARPRIVNTTTARIRPRRASSVPGTLLALAAILAPSLAGAGERVERVREAFAARLPGVAIDTLTPTPAPGVFKIAHEGGVLYLSEDGRYAFTGKLLDLETREHLTERTRARQRLSLLAEVPESSLIVFEPDGEARHTSTTFTDIDCPYCRKMHGEIAPMNAGGIRVRYLAYPRTGFSSVSYDKAVSVWCAPDPRSATTRAKADEMPEKHTCENPIAAHVDLARRVWLTGTPFTITDTGRVITGYMPAPTLLESLEADERRVVR